MLEGLFGLSLDNWTRLIVATSVLLIVYALAGRIITRILRGITGRTPSGFDHAVAESEA